jgi:PTH2 family peptidyl-tRNA hydrolase
MNSSLKDLAAVPMLKQTVMKQVIVLRTDLHMSAGKSTVQACHASVAAVLCAKTVDLEQWNGEGQTKIALAVNSLAELESLKSRCEALGILHVLISDAGRAELAPGTITALAIGPADEALIDRVTGFTPMLK